MRLHGPYHGRVGAVRRGATGSVAALFARPKMLALLVFGFSSGLPFYLTGRVLQAWMTVEGVDLATIGAFSLVALPYSFKFVWAPLLDRYIPPFLGRRRGWLLLTQLALLGAIAAMALQDPGTGIRLLAANAVAIAFLSASQDVAADAYRADVLEEREMGAGAAIFVLGYRIALLVTGSLAFVLADRLPWPAVYLALATLMLPGIAASLRGPEPVLHGRPPQTLAEAVRLPFLDFFRRAGLGRGLLVLLFIVLYRLSDSLAQNMATPFLLQTGFSQTDIGVFQGGVGLGATLAGALAGGVVVARLGINRSLWVAGALQAGSNLAYYGLALVGRSYPFLVGTVVVENFFYGLVTSAFVAFLMSLCDPRFTATQYALLSSLMAASRDVLVAPAGAVAQAAGWPAFFLITLAAGIPGLALLPAFAPWRRAEPLVAATHTGEVTAGRG